MSRADVTAAIAADFAAAFQEAGDAITYDGTPGFGQLLREPMYVDDSRGGVTLAGVRTTLRVRAGAFPGLVSETDITVAGIAYRIRNVEPPDTKGNQLLHLEAL